MALKSVPSLLAVCLLGAFVLGAATPVAADSPPKEDGQAESGEGRCDLITWGPLPPQVNPRCIIRDLTRSISSNFGGPIGELLHRVEKMLG